MNLFFEESGDFKAGVALSQQGEAFQVELQSGKRTKVRARDVLLQFASPGPAELLQAARTVADEIDADFLWEVAGQEEFDYADLGAEYFGHKPQPHEAAGLLLRLQAAPMYFYKKGKGRYKAAPETSLKAALAGIERKKQLALVQSAYVDELSAGRLPDAMRAMVPQLLFKPDKNGIEYKALDAACTALQTTPQRLMLSLGGFPSAKDLHLSKFLLEHFPKGREFPPVPEMTVPDLPVAEVEAFSIDDVTTTEIDDAFSLSTLADGTLRIGIHIAAPALCISRDDAMDAAARQRMSTVYMPGDKITMLPDALVERFTLAEGKTCPALSLYVTVDPNAQWIVTGTETRAEMVPMSANLRHNDLDAIVTEENLAEAAGDYPHKQEIVLLWKWAQVLEAGRMAKRESFGLKPEQTNRVDFNFYVEDDRVTIARRKRGAPLDKIVAELMIFANSAWGKLMNEAGVPGIYRTQSRGPGPWPGRMQVKMQTHAAPHQGLGVDCYAWTTSPLRRYTDLVNQRQILACIEHGVTAPLAAPYKPRDADLFAIVSAFDAAYGAYADFQSVMERYWCLRWLAQENVRRVEAVVLKEEILRLAEIPLVIRLPGMPQLARGAQVRLDLVGWDELDLNVEARLIEVVSGVAEETSLAETEDEAEELEKAVASDADDEMITPPAQPEADGEAPPDGEAMSG